MAAIPRLERIATDGPFLEVTDWGVWRIELGEAYMRTRFWTVGDRIMIEKGAETEGFTHTLTNIDAPGDEAPVAAHKLEAWPEGRGPEAN